MFSMWAKVLAVAAAVLLQCAAADPAASTFYFNETGTTFAINLPANSSDMYIYFSSPAFSWVAVGAGTQMTGSLMFVMYKSAGGKNVTISPRIATGNNEPTFDPSIQISTLPGTGIQDDSFILNALCRNCRTWHGGSLDLSTRSQSWMFAYGPDLDLESDSPSAGLRRHDHFGFFTMDMVQAQGDAGVPIPQLKMDGAAMVGIVKKDGDRAGLVHAAAMCFAILILLPLKVAVSGMRPKSRMNMVVGSIFLIFVMAAFGLGISVSLEYNRSKHFSSGHQVLGFIIVALILLLFVHGIMIQPKRKIPDQHQSVWTGQEYTQIKLPPPRAATARFHTWGGRGLWMVAILNAGLGFNFASAPQRTRIIFAMIVIAIALVMGIVYSCIWLKWKKAKTPKMGEDSDVVLQNYWQSGSGHGHALHVQQY